MEGTEEAFDTSTRDNAAQTSSAVGGLAEHLGGRSRQRHLPEQEATDQVQQDIAYAQQFSLGMQGCYSIGQLFPAVPASTELDPSDLPRALKAYYHHMAESQSIQRAAEEARQRLLEVEQKLQNFRASAAQVARSPAPPLPPAPAPLAAVSGSWPPTAKPAPPQVTVVPATAEKPLPPVRPSLPLPGAPLPVPFSTSAPAGRDKIRKNNLENGGTFACFGVHKSSIIQSTARLYVSDSFEVDVAGTPMEFRVQITAKQTEAKKRGHCFSMAKGKGKMELKCEGVPETDSPFRVCFLAGPGVDRLYRFLAGEEGALQRERLLLERRETASHDFAVKSVCSLPSDQELWDFSNLLDNDKQVYVGVEILPLGCESATAAAAAVAAAAAATADCRPPPPGHPEVPPKEDGGTEQLSAVDEVSRASYKHLDHLQHHPGHIDEHTGVSVAIESEPLDLENLEARAPADEALRTSSSICITGQGSAAS